MLQLSFTVEMVSGWARRTARGPVDIDKEKRHTSTGWAHVWLIRHDVGIAVPWSQRDAFVFDQHGPSLEGQRPIIQPWYSILIER